MLRRLFAITVIGLAVAGCLGPPEESAAVEESGVKTAAQLDAELAADFAKGPEARAWLSQDNTAFFEISKEDALRLVDSLYSAGAVKVVIADNDRLTEESKVEIAATVIAELPTEPAKRKAVFAVEKDWAEFDPEKDIGQKYLQIVTD